MRQHPDTAHPLSQTLTMILAGGQGERLYPLTLYRAKPAVPFGGNYRLIDFALSNCLNSGVRRILVLTQYKSDSLDRHIRLGWNMLTPEMGEYIEIRSPQQRLTSHWYLGTADAIYQNIYTLDMIRPRYVLVLSGDHVYKMDYSRLVEHHVSKGADLTIACMEMPIQEAFRLGVVTVDDGMRAVGFQEKPETPEAVAGRPDIALCSMGIYVFRAEVLVRRVIEDSKKSTSHDFGCDVVPAMIAAGDRVFAFKFMDENRKDTPYWRDIGTLDAYWEANMDLVKVTPEFNLYDKDWPIRTYQEQSPPGKTVWGGEQDKARIGRAINSLIANGCVISGGMVKYSILFPGVRINSFAEIHDSIIMEDTDVGRYAKIKRAIIDKDVAISQGARIGYNSAEDKRRFTVTDSGIVVVPKGSVV